jgi:DNA-binding NarL/FixJ family response regulator
LRDQEVFNLIGKGTGNEEIASHLGISIGTVGTYVNRIVQNLDVGNRRALRKYVVESILPMEDKI